MKLTVLNWFKDALITFVGRAIEILFRIILFILPLGVYLYIIQSRNKASKVSNISVYTTDESVWQHIFPGFILVAVDPNVFKKAIARTKGNIQLWVQANRYILGLIFMILIVLLMVISEVLK